MSVVLRAALIALSIASLGGVLPWRPSAMATGQQPSTPPSGTASALVWPPPPAPARIRFVRALDPASARRKPSVFSRLARLIVGARDEPRMLQPYGIAV